MSQPTPPAVSPIDAPSIALLSVNIGRPTVIGQRRSRPILSAIVKRPVAAAIPTLTLTDLNLDGDGQADLSVHGGIDKAVYAYPSEHLPRWNVELGTSFGPGTFGENLTIGGLLEDDARIGDIWAWGDALLQIAQPRSPCYKLATVTGQPIILKRMVANGRTGWYLRVLRPGQVPTAGPIKLVERDPAGLTVLDAHRATARVGIDRDRLIALVTHPALAESWRGWVRQGLDG